MVSSAIFEEFVEFLASKKPQDILDFMPSNKASERYEFLVSKEKNEGLSQEEKEELENFSILERIMRRAKARARIILAGQ